MSEYAQVPRHNPKAAKSLEGSFYGHTQVETSALCQLLTSFYGRLLAADYYLYLAIIQNDNCKHNRVRLIMVINNKCLFLGFLYENRGNFNSI